MGYNDLEIGAGVVMVALSTLSVAASLTTARIIWDLQRWNGYMLLVFYLSLWEAVYDLAAFFLVAYRSDICFTIYKLLAVSAGTAVSLWINLISLILLYTVCALKSVDIAGNIYRMRLVVVIVSMGLGIALAAMYQRHPHMETLDLAYYWLRVGSIAGNVLIFVVLFALLGNHCLSRWLGAARGGDYDETRQLLAQLTARLAYYPAVQILTRAGASWWEYQYGFRADSLDGPPGAWSRAKRLSLFLFAVSNSSAGMGYFLVFINVQPLAYGRLVALAKTWRGEATDAGGFGDEASVHALDEAVEVTRPLLVYPPPPSPSGPSDATTANSAVHSVDADASSNRTTRVARFSGMDEERLWQEIMRRKQSRDTKPIVLHGTP